MLPNIITVSSARNTARLRKSTQIYVQFDTNHAVARVQSGTISTVTRRTLDVAQTDKPQHRAVTRSISFLN